MKGPGIKGDQGSSSKPQAAAPKDTDHHCEVQSPSSCSHCPGACWLLLLGKDIGVTFCTEIVFKRWASIVHNTRGNGLFLQVAENSGSILTSSLVAQMVKRLPTVQETWVQSLGREDPLEKEMATHSSTLAWRIPWTEKPGRLQSMGSQRVGHDWETSLSLSIGKSIPGSGLNDLHTQFWNQFLIRWA